MVINNYQNNLIFDLGMHTGEDTEFYLLKGFKVIAIEANPIMVELANVKFKFDIENDNLKIINVGISSLAGMMNFYVNTQHTEWSTFDATVGASRGDYSKLEVRTCTLSEIVSEYGIPYYIKIDIESMDYPAVESLSPNQLPPFISVENGHQYIIEKLYDAGYKKFKFINQMHNTEIILPDCQYEGRNISFKFKRGSSGPFGRDLTGTWLTKEEVVSLSNDYWSLGIDREKAGWYDLHATYLDF
jgi:FkbM family methyltransferase